MSTITLTRRQTQATPFERMLLTTASGLDRFVEQRMEYRSVHRAVARSRAALHRAAVQRAASDARATAQALGAAGILPR